MKFERIVEFEPAFDKRHPNPSQNYGIGSVRIRFVLKGDKGAVQVLMGTNLYLPETIKEYKTKGIHGKIVDLLSRENDCSGLSGWDVGYHSPKPMYPDQKPIGDDCKYTSGKCYYDGSGLRAQKLPELLIREGSDAIWKFLEEEYNQVFGDTE